MFWPIAGFNSRESSSTSAGKAETGSYHCVRRAGPSTACGCRSKSAVNSFAAALCFRVGVRYEGSPVRVLALNDRVPTLRPSYQTIWQSPENLLGDMHFLALLVPIVLATIVRAAPVADAAAAECAICPDLALDGASLVASSGGTQGVPRFCGFSADSTGASGPQCICFYNNDGSLSYSSTGACPTETTLQSCVAVP
ncbi:hypothetical protein BD626DRAFT_505240 [Schizophyllum amplum]|uniref:Uncharacterized protein n=1 Tax=Schizophyllum amplum TaxID=97359 RepID=A0A550C6I6_9AGAR|nr:hypothetical protein BD626DRAFT_505240 [Auriculariopsis ampla]